MLKRPFGTALAFTAALVAFEALTLTPGYLALRDYRLVYGNSAAAILFGTLLASTGLFVLIIWASLRAHRAVKVAYFLVFALAATIEYGYQHGFSRFSEVLDYEVGIFAINTHHVKALTAFVNVLVLVPCAVYAWLLFKARAVAPRSAWKDAAVLAALFASLAAMLSGAATAASRNEPLNYPALSVVASIRTLTGVAWRQRLNPEPRLEVAYRAPTAPQDNIILVVAESMRGDHLSINGYSRPTTPVLDDLATRGALTNWGVAAAAFTCSLASNLALLTGTNVAKELSWTPTIFQYAKAMGYRTHYVDGQMTNAWNGTPRDRATWDVWLTANEFDRDGISLVDSHIGARVADVVTNSVGNFIWINKWGVHVPYDLNYPSSEAAWTPVYGGRGVAMRPLLAPLDFSRRQAFVNSFDNALRWSVESFFRSLLADGIPEHTTLVYTGDHGQTLGENGERHSHCGSSRSEAIVPLFIVSSRPDVRGADTGFLASHANVFPTVLDLMGFPESERPRDYAVSLLKAKSSDSRPRTYGGSGGTFAFDAVAAPAPVKQ